MSAIRPATLADIPSLLALERQSITAAHWSEAQYHAAIASSIPPRIVLVAEEKSAMQGFLVARAASHEWEIENIAVAAPARRQGLGTRLLCEFIALARRQRAAAVLLEVRASNHAARTFYEKCAFAEAGRRKEYYREPAEDAVLYRLSFPGDSPSSQHPK
jgi:ribosomal-protein-alanine N-acetyltransferase